MIHPSPDGGRGPPSRAYARGPVRKPCQSPRAQALLAKVHAKLAPPERVSAGTEPRPALGGVRRAAHRGPQWRKGQDVCLAPDRSPWGPAKATPTCGGEPSRALCCTGAAGTRATHAEGVGGLRTDVAEHWLCWCHLQAVCVRPSRASVPLLHAAGPGGPPVVVEVSVLKHRSNGPAFPRELRCSTSA